MKDNYISNQRCIFRARDKDHRDFFSALRGKMLLDTREPGGSRIQLHVGRGNPAERAPRQAGGYNGGCWEVGEAFSASMAIWGEERLVEDHICKKSKQDNG